MNAADASFALSTNTLPGFSQLISLTDTRSVCDAAGNCTQAGPYSFSVDLAPPVCFENYINFYQTLNSNPFALANLGRFRCTDNFGTGGSGVASASPVALPDVNTTIGYHNLTWAATDRVGNVGVPPNYPNTYIVTYLVKYLYDWTLPVPSGGTQTVTLAAYDANGANVSKPELIVTAIGPARTTAYPLNRFKYDSTLDGGQGGYRFAVKIGLDARLGLNGTPLSVTGYWGGLKFQFSDEAATMHLYRSAPYTVG